MRLTKITYPDAKVSKKSEEELKKERKEKEKEDWKRTLLLQHDGQSKPGNRFIVVEKNEEEEEEPTIEEQAHKAEKLKKILDEKFEYINKKDKVKKEDKAHRIKIFRQSIKRENETDDPIFVPTKRPLKKELSEVEKQKRMKTVMVDYSQIIASADSYSYIPRTKTKNSNSKAKKDESKKEKSKKEDSDKDESEKDERESDSGGSENNRFEGKFNQCTPLH